MILTLLFTIIIEILVLLALRERRKRVLWASVIVNILTNIPLNMYVKAVHPKWGIILLAEGIVFIVETLWYYLFIREMSKAAIYSFLCNAISFLLGLLFTFLSFLLPL